jgi:DNA modification methylase
VTRRSTSTSTFGVSRRESHDASRYYARQLVSATVTADTTVNRVSADVTGRFYRHTSEAMTELPDNSVALVVTSPPYAAGKDFDRDMEPAEFLAMLERVLVECHRVLEPGGRLAVNVANLGRKPYVLLADIVGGMCADIGYLPRGEIIWVKAKGASGSAAFGSYLQPSNPVLRDVHEYILVFCKGRFERAWKWRDRKELDMPWEATITKEAFLRDTLSVWYMRPESAKRVKHPAPFPVELPYRLIDLYTFRGDIVIDPFCGAGTAAVAAKRLGRRWVGYDLDSSYLETAEARIDATAVEEMEA